MMIRHADGTVHFSALKKFALSPAHYKAACENPTDPTRAMKIGTGTHFILLGPREGQQVVRFDGPDRRAKGYKEFAAANAGAEILTAGEWDECEAIAAAVRADPEAKRWLANTRKEVPLKWTASGLPCSTSGVDFIGQGYLGELKTTTCTEPTIWSRHALRMLYHCQLAWYRDGARENKIDTSKGLVIIGVETAPPYAVTCLELTEAAILQGEKSITLWLEKLRAAEANDHWPTYTQTTIPLDVPEWMTGEGDEDLDETEKEVA